MYCIYKIRSNPTVDYAAEELKKYLRMMMPRCGEITIAYAPDATNGFRLGLLEDFALKNEAVDPVWDDVLHIDTDDEGGIIAGSNPRSVLLAVYRFLQENGCRWLFPGVDGEYIPLQEIRPTKYHKMADVRVRAQCNEGCESQTSVLETIEFSPKIGLNSYMLEFDNPKVYYGYYYNHKYNTTNREPEPVSNMQVLQWKRQCEAEIAKRGLIFQDMGHGWTAEPFGLDTTEGWAKNPDQKVPEESREYIAFVEGARAPYHHCALNTNFCMSNPKAREIVVRYIADYAAAASHVQYLHVWLADSTNNHCECAACRKKTPSDWYAILMNELDAELTERGLQTRIVFCVYYDTAWAPRTEKILHPERFTLLLGAITRSYTETPNMVADHSRLWDFCLNQNKYPVAMSEYMAHMENWQKVCPAPKFCYEYHFWVHQYYDVGGLSIAKRIYEDILAYRAAGFDGIIEDGSQRSFFPNGFAFFVYGQTLFDNSVDFDVLKQDYFSHAYGEHWQDAVAYLKEMGERFDPVYMSHRHRGEKKDYACAEKAQDMEKVIALADEMAPRIAQWQKCEYRAQTVAAQLLNLHTYYCKELAKAVSLRAQGKEAEALLALQEFFDHVGKYELQFERYFDFGLIGTALTQDMFRGFKKPVKEEVG